MRSTHTLAVMHLPADVVELIRGKLAAAGYDHAIDEHDGLQLDMTGIAIAPDDEDDEPDHLPDDIEPPDDTPEPGQLRRRRYRRGPLAREDLTMNEQREYPLAWRNDCQGKKDYDGRLVEVSTRYWPPNYDAHGQHTAHSSILLGGMAVTDRNFTAPTIAECKRQVEQWVASQIQILEAAVIGAFTTAAGAPSAGEAAFRKALADYPGRNTHQLQARKVCAGVTVLAEAILARGR